MDKELASAISDLRIARARIEQRLEIMQQQFAEELRKLHELIHSLQQRQGKCEAAEIQEFRCIDDYCAARMTRPIS